jgi:hypothetical protein
LKHSPARQRKIGRETIHGFPQETDEQESADSAGLRLFCLALGTGSGALIHPAAGASSAWFDGVRGLLLGVGIGLNLAAALQEKSSCGNRPGSVESV